MPTDENNGVNSQNQQVNPNGDQTAQNVGGSDDFDFNFDDSSDNQSDNGLSGDMQDQMRRQGRSGMFLTPDEVITKSNDNIDMSSGQLDLSSTVQPQRRSGMFLTPDEEAIKEETQIEGKQYSFQGTAEDQGEASEDSYLAGIDPNDVDVSGDDEEIDGGNKQQSDYSHDSLNEEIEDLISFGDESKANSESDPLSKPVETSTETSVETPVSESPVEQIVEQNVQPTSEDSQVQDTNSTDNGNVGDSEDWLSQEDKKVEESFGTESGNISPDVDVPPETVSQNVENVINEANNSGVVSQDQNVQPVMENDLHIENMGTDVVENGNGDLISDTGGMQQMNQNNSYVPNETEFNQMSEILNSSSIGQIDLSNINDDQQTVQQVEPVESVQGPVDPVQGPVDPVQEPVDSVQEPTVQLDSPVSGTEINQVDSAVQAPVDIPVEIPVSMSQAEIVQNGLKNQADNELLKYEGGESQGPVVSQDAQMNTVSNEPVAEINLDSLLSETTTNQDTIQNTETTNGSLIGVVNEGVQAEQQTQSTPQKRKKKQSGFTVLLIVFGSLILLGVVGFVASKMFPEEFARIFKKESIISGLITDTKENIGDENIIDEENPDEGNVGENIIDEENPDEGNVGENIIDEENPDGVIGEQEPDPDSLAGQLLQEDGENGGELEVNKNDEDGENLDGNTDTGIVVENGENSEEGTGDFDPFAEFSDILEEAQETIEKLNGYVSSGQYYIDWGETNGKPTISTVGRKVIEMAQGELTKLENGGEIDTTAFDRMDELLKKLSTLAK